MDYTCETCGQPAFARYEDKWWCPDCFLAEYVPEGPAWRYSLAAPKAAERYRRGILLPPP